MQPSKDDKKELDKFTKFLALKAAEVIVQSRLGQKVSTSCKPGPDWFNLNISDLPEVVIEAKKVLNSDLFLMKKSPFCIEISLRTVEDDDMVLESWCARLLDHYEPGNNNNGQNIYNRMGILLKSLVSVSRVIPAYKLSRRQSPDSYIICYRMYMDEPLTHNLGEQHKQILVGQICTSIGTVQLSCAYRTKMTISLSKNNSSMLKSGYFNTNLSPRNRHISSLTETMKIGAFADGKRKYFEVPQLDLPICEFFVNRISLFGKQPDEEESDLLEDGEINEAKNDTRNDFFMTELKMPFAKRSGEKFELSKFFREWQQAPSLQTFKEVPPIEGNDLRKLLEIFERDLNEFHNIVQSLCQSSPNNN